MFLQMSSRHQTQNSIRAKVVEKLRKAAAKTGSTTLSALAASAQLDAFTKVKKAIDDMVTELKKQQDDQIKHKDFCVEEFAQNEKQRAVKQDEIDDLTAFIEDTKAKLDTLKK